MIVRTLMDLTPALWLPTSILMSHDFGGGKGVFLGVSVEAGTLVTRKDANRDFYGADASAQELLLGDYPAPKAAEPLYAALREVRKYWFPGEAMG